MIMTLSDVLVKMRPNIRVGKVTAMTSDDLFKSDEKENVASYVSVIDSLLAQSEFVIRSSEMLEARMNAASLDRSINQDP